MATTQAKRSAKPAPIAMAAAPKRGQNGVYVYTLDDAPWRELGRPGVKDKSVRREAATGQYLGLIAFEPLSRSGLHQHLGTALSYFLAGSLVDYQGGASEGMAGINLAGATHDAVTYTGALLASRLEGPVVSPEGVTAAHPIRGGVKEGRLMNPFPERWPDINIPVLPLPLVPTHFAGIGRRVIFDYSGTGDRRRFAALTIMPHAPAIEIAHQGLTDWYVLAGDVSVGGKRAYANSFVILEPGARVEIASEYGCHLLCWAEARGVGAATGGAKGAETEIYGF